jgi:ribosomal-protein-alanine acetyltransferase
MRAPLAQTPVPQNPADLAAGKEMPRRPEILTPAPEILPLRAADVAEVVALEAAAQEFPWSQRHFEDALAAGYFGWGVRVGGLLSAHAFLMVAVDEAHLLNIAVAPALRRRGLGARLLWHLLDWAAGEGLARMFLEVRAANAPALALYRAFGFVQVGVRKAYYPAKNGREDALVYCRALATGGA